MLLAQTKSTEYHLLDGVLVSRLKPIAKMTLDDVLQNAEVRKTLPIAFPIPFLMDIRLLDDMTLRAIMATSNQDDVTKFSAAAILFAKVEQQLIAREANRFHHASIPLKTFQDEEKAMTWLKGYL